MTRLAVSHHRRDADPSMTVTRYGRPFLRVDDAYVDPVGGSAVVRRGREVFDVRIDGVEGKAIVSELQRFRRGPLGGDAEPWVWELLDQLDLLGLVDDSDDGREVVGRESGDIRAAITECAAWLGTGPSPACARAAALRLRDEGLPASLQIDEPLPWVSDGKGGANVPLTALALQLRYLRSSARLSYAAVRCLLCEVIGEDPVPWAGVVESRCGADEDPDYAVAALNATASLLMLATRPDAARLLTPPRCPATARLSGVSHVLRVEEAVRDAVASLGDVAVAEVLRRDPPHAALLRSAIAEQSLVSRRLADTMLPALVARLRGSIRRQLAAYQFDELSRRPHDDAACRAVGVEPRELDERLLLPWFQVLVDAHLAIAQADTGTFLAAVMVTEGCPGDLFGVRRRLGPAGGPLSAGDPGRDGTVGTGEAGHTARARALLSEVPSVTAFRHRSVVESVVLLAELAERAWRQLLDLHTHQAAACWLPPAYHRQSAPSLDPS